MAKAKPPKLFRVTGKFLMGNRYQKFTKELLTVDPKEKLYSELGSKHRVKRRRIKIEAIKELKKEDCKDPVLRGLLESG